MCGGIFMYCAIESDMLYVYIYTIYVFICHICIDIYTLYLFICFQRMLIYIFFIHIHISKPKHFFGWLPELLIVQPHS
jgi:hypothetical protein